MDMVVLLFLTSGLFLGWSLGANDAANVFGTAVGTRMVKFTTAAVVCSIFVILGATFSGAGAAHTLGKLGSVNALGGSFMAAFAAAITVYWMTKLGLPVSTSQAIVGAIIGWNLFSGSITDTKALIKILSTWVACPLLAGCIAVPIYIATTKLLGLAKFHLIRLDAYTRYALIFAGAFGSYSLGANNIANVMGVFVPVSPFTDFAIGDFMTFSSVQQLFLLGAIAIAVGVFTYSKRVMLTVGGGLMPLSPVGAWVVVISHSIVLFLFASQGLEHLLASNGLPTIPLVPVSSSQAVVGAVIGIGLYKGGKGIKWKVLVNISGGWVTTPIISALVCFVCLFFLQNVFDQRVYTEIHFSLTKPVMEKLATKGVSTGDLTELEDKTYPRAVDFRSALRDVASLSTADEYKVIQYAEITPITIDPAKFEKMDPEWLSENQITAVRGLSGKSFDNKWGVADALATQSPEWKTKPDTKVNKMYNKAVKNKLAFVYRTFAVK
jgi:inorganic phosphate transporter, PiT family